jgi:LacI family transcriptional regulator
MNSNLAVNERWSRVDHAPPKPSYYSVALRLIRQRALEGVSVDEIFEALPVSRSTLERQFAAHLGRTPGQEMLRVRLEHAKQVLATTDIPVKNIAGMMGYERPTNFSDFFRKETGVSPRAFRARIRGARGRSTTEHPAGKPIHAKDL